MNYKTGDKVTFEYWDNELGKDVFGRGWVREIDTDNKQIIVSTTRGLKWMEIEAIKTTLKQNTL